LKITSLLDKKSINVNLKSHTKFGVITEIVRYICDNKKLKDRKNILRNILEREKKGSTGIGNGVAIPHARIENLKEIVIFIGVSRQGIDFHSIDNKPAHLIILFITPIVESETHLRILSQIGNLAKDRRLVKRILEVKTSDELFQLLQILESDGRGFLSLTKEEVYLELGTSDAGLSESEVDQRLAKYGQNKLRRIRKKSLVKSFINNFTNLLAILMWVGSILAFLAEMQEVGWAIIAVIIINAIFSFWQEFKAEKAINALKNLIPSYARVIRDGTENRINSENIVPGDIIVLEEGDNISADARLIEANELRVDNSVFSGETKPTYKMSNGFKDGEGFLWTELPNLVFAGTSVASGGGKAVVVATGMSTEIGKIAFLTQTVKESLSPLQKEINRLTRVITLIAIAMGFVFFFIGTYFTRMSFAACAIFAIGIILGNVPEGLLPTVTLSLAMAVQRMAKRHALIKKLSSVETLGCTTVICTDKTGTITTNQMSVNNIWIDEKIIRVTGTSYKPEGKFIFKGRTLPAGELKNDSFTLLMRTSVMCSTARLIPPSGETGYWNIIGDPTEGALLVMAKKAGIDIDAERNKFPYVKRFPFESVRKRMSTVNRMPDGSLCAFVKGAPKEIVELTTRIVVNGKETELTEDKKSKISMQIDEFAKEGLRVLAIAYRKITGLINQTPTKENGTFSELSLEITSDMLEKDLVLIGIVAMYDPPRPEVKEALSKCKEAGIRVVMITGDYQLTALSIAKQVGMVGDENLEIISGRQLDEMSDEELKEKLITREVIFSRVNPEHKLRVVNAFKELDDIVAVTGDGVNDAPALKRADIGVAMGIRGTDVAKESAEMVLTDDNFASIVHAIEEGRAVFDNIKKFVIYIFAHLVPEAVPFIFYALLKIPAPITAMQILAIDLGTETIPALALGVEKPEPGIMKLRPRSQSRRIIDKTVLFRGYVFLGLLNTVFVLLAYFLVLFKGGWKFGVQLEPSETSFINPLHLKAVTMIFVGIVVMQIANVFACRSEKISSLKLGFFENRLILWGILFEMAFVSVLIYTPFFQKIFNTAALGLKDWSLLFLFMIAMFSLEELRKRFFVKRMEEQKRS
jgi:magnesium-transporting ATPase (P-type)